jgi:hypothetical protein
MSNNFFHKRARRDLFKDLVVVFIGLVVSLVLVNLGIIGDVVILIGNTHVSSFLSGIFFTSIFTIAPASAVFTHLAGEAPIWLIVVWGALGALFGDILLFFFIKDRFADDVMDSLKPSLKKHILSSFHFGFMKWLAPIIGALLIASPLPNEFGVALLGMSRTKMYIFVPISFVLNLLAVYSLVWFAGAI